MKEQRLCCSMGGSAGRCESLPRGGSALANSTAVVETKETSIGAPAVRNFATSV